MASHILSRRVAAYSKLLQEKKYDEAVMQMFEDHGEEVDGDIVMALLSFIPHPERIQNMLAISSRGRVDILERFHTRYGFNAKEINEVEHWFTHLEIPFGDILAIYTVRMMISFLMTRLILDTSGIQPYYMKVRKS
jgi:hypothetical protein